MTYYSICSVRTHFRHLPLPLLRQERVPPGARQDGQERPLQLGQGLLHEASGTLLSAVVSNTFEIGSVHNTGFIGYSDI